MRESEYMKKSRGDRNVVTTIKIKQEVKMANQMHVGKELLLEVSLKSDPWLSREQWK